MVYMETVKIKVSNGCIFNFAWRKCIAFFSDKKFRLVQLTTNKCIECIVLYLLYAESCSKLIIFNKNVTI